MAAGFTGVGWSPLFADCPPTHRSPAPYDLDFLPREDWDDGARVRCLHDTLQHFAAGLPRVRLIDQLRPAGIEFLALFHTEAYLRAAGVLTEPQTIQARAAMLAAGAVLDLTRRVWTGEFRNAYALVRPPGHHSRSDAGGGGCLLGNGVLAVLMARRLGARRVLMLDWDAHHGNSQQDAFWADPTVLTISLHQARRFPPGTGGADAVGSGAVSNINIPVPMGSGGGVYRAAFRQAIRPAVERFRPEMIIVSSGLDASYLDPSARLALHSEDFGWLAAQTVILADEYANGRLLLTHEGGYARHYLPFCFLRILEALSGAEPVLPDPHLERWGRDFAATVSAEAKVALAEAADRAGQVPKPC